MADNDKAVQRGKGTTPDGKKTPSFFDRLIGSGLAGAAGKKLKGRGQSIEERIKKAGG